MPVLSSSDNELPVNHHACEITSHRISLELAWTGLLGLPLCSISHLFPNPSTAHWKTENRNSNVTTYSHPFGACLKHDQTRCINYRSFHSRLSKACVYRVEWNG